MYRQIRVHKDNWSLQQILWRDSTNEELQAYFLCTVTYDLACAPYLRCLQQLATEGLSQYPLAAEILCQNTYVDDILSGAESLTLARQKITELKALLMTVCFPLQKCMSNCDELLTDISSNHRETSSTLPDDDSLDRTLGLL